MLIIISDPHSFAMCCSETLFVITLQWASVVGSRCSGCYEAHPSFGSGTSYWMRIYNGSIGVVLQFALYVCVF